MTTQSIAIKKISQILIVVEIVLEFFWSEKHVGMAIATDSPMKVSLTFVHALLSPTIYYLCVHPLYFIVHVSHLTEMSYLLFATTICTL